MAIPREGSRNTGDGILISNLPDWCRSPQAPVAYTIFARQNDHEANTATTVRQTGQRSHTKGSLITTCHGDEPGTGLGVKSNTVGSVCTPQTYSKTVRFEGRNAVRHTDTWWMNNRNTTGKLVYVKNVENYEPTPQARQDWEVKAGSDEGRVVSDASPDPLEPGEKYAQAVFFRPLPPIEVLGPRTGPVAPRVAPRAPAPETNVPKPAPRRFPPIEVGRTPGNNRTTEDENKRRKDCKIAPYKSNPCPGEAAHHGIVDFPLRLGDNDSALKPPDIRAPGAPYYPDALTICLDDTTHNLVHAGLNTSITRSAQDGLTNWENVRAKAFDSIDRLPEDKVTKECKEMFKRALDGQYNIDPNMTLRGTTRLPENVPGAYDALSKAWGFV